MGSTQKKILVFILDVNSVVEWKELKADTFVVVCQKNPNKTQLHHKNEAFPLSGLCLHITIKNPSESQPFQPKSKMSNNGKSKPTAKH